MRPDSSQESASSAEPYPFSTAQSTPLTITSSSSDFLSRTAPFEPTPEGMAPNRSDITSFMRGRICSSSRSVLSSLTPQLMSYPTPPGLIMPSSASMAATPPTGNPYPSCPSGSTTPCPTMPGMDATLQACLMVRSVIIFSSSVSSAYMRTGAMRPDDSSGSITYWFFPARTGRTVWSGIYLRNGKWHFKS